jgi:hypothetical protein
LDFYVGEWKRLSYQGDVVRTVARLPMESAWTVLLRLAPTTLANNQTSNELISALGAMLNADRLPVFCEFLRQESVASWQPDSRASDGIVQRIVSALSRDVAQWQWFLMECKSINSVASSALGMMVFSRIAGAADLCIELAVSALASGHVSNPHSMIYHTFLELFANRTPLEVPGHFQIVSNSANALRREIYRRACLSDPSAPVCRHLLAAVEKMRMDYGRPVDELRHPDPDSGSSWTDVLCH